MSFFISIVTSLTSGILLFIVKNVWNENKQLRQERNTNLKVREDALKDGIVCLLRVKLIEYHDHYVAVGGIPSYAYSNFIMMYDAYKTLGGNGMIDHMKEEIDELEINRNNEKSTQ